MLCHGITSRNPKWLRTSACSSVHATVDLPLPLRPAVRSHGSPDKRQPVFMLKDPSFALYRLASAKLQAERVHNRLATACHPPAAPLTREPQHNALLPQQLLLCLPWHHAVMELDVCGLAGSTEEQEEVRSPARAGTRRIKWCPTAIHSMLHPA